MPLSSKSAEIQRLIEAFEGEAAKFHDLQFRTIPFRQASRNFDGTFAKPNHAIMLWQYYGAIKEDHDAEEFVANVNDSNLQWGLCGSALTVFGVIEGEACKLFVRMAIRAGSIFDADETRQIRSRVVSEFVEAEKAKDESAKPIGVTNDNPLAIWLNFLLYHLSLTNPGRELARRIEPDLFSLSLMALERLAEGKTIGKVDRSSRSLRDLKFKVAVSFPGERRRYVSRVVDVLRARLSQDSVFYDYDYQAQLARPNLDIALQKVYRDQSELVVVFLCGEYAKKQWCGLEWRAVRDIIKSKGDDRVMLVRFDGATVDGLLSIDGCIDAASRTTKEIADLILTRVSEIDGHPQTSGS
jgi:TIR domain